MKIVVCFSDEVVCCNYESTEAFLVHFEEKVREAKAQIEKGRADWMVWEAAKPQGNLMNARVRAAVTDYVANNPPLKRRGGPALISVATFSRQRIFCEKTEQ